MFPIMLNYVLFLAFAGVHIFRVRVLRQDRRKAYNDQNDYWPFLSREQYRQLREAQ
jgi:hypothetical protein